MPVERTSPVHLEDAVDDVADGVSRYKVTSLPPREAAHHDLVKVLTLWRETPA